MNITRLTALAILVLFAAPTSADEAPNECGWQFPAYEAGDTAIEVPLGAAVPLAGDFYGGWNCSADPIESLSSIVTDADDAVLAGGFLYTGQAHAPMALFWSPAGDVDTGRRYTLLIRQNYTFPGDRQPPLPLETTVYFEYSDAPLALFEIADPVVELRSATGPVTECCEVDGIEECRVVACEGSLTAHAIWAPQAQESFLPHLTWSVLARYGEGEDRTVYVGTTGSTDELVTDLRVPQRWEGLVCGRVEARVTATGQTLAKSAWVCADTTEIHEPECVPEEPADCDEAWPPVEPDPSDTDDPEAEPPDEDADAVSTRSRTSNCAVVATTGAPWSWLLRR